MTTVTVFEDHVLIRRPLVRTPLGPYEETVRVTFAEATAMCDALLTHVKSGGKIETPDMLPGIAYGRVTRTFEEPGK